MYLVDLFFVFQNFYVSSASWNDISWWTLGQVIITLALIELIIGFLQNENVQQKIEDYLKKWNEEDEKRRKNESPYWPVWKWGSLLCLLYLLCCNHVYRRTVDYNNDLAIDESFDFLYWSIVLVPIAYISFFIYGLDIEDVIVLKGSKSGFLASVPIFVAFFLCLFAYFGEFSLMTLGIILITLTLFDLSIKFIISKEKQKSMITCIV